MDWEPWLRRWSEERIESTDPAEPDPEVLRDRWLGFAPATAESIAAAQARIDHTLPPSYRQFLLTTDGWRDAGEFVPRMRDTSNLGWLRDLEPHWEAWEELAEEWDRNREEEDDDAHPDADPQDGNRFSQSLLISLDADAGILFLDPGDIDDAGEWAAYSLFSWNAEPPTKYTSFTALMEDLYAEFREMRQPTSEPRGA